MRYPSNTQYTSRNSFHHQHYCVPVGNSTSHTLHHHHPSSLSTEAVAWPCVTGCRLSKLSSFQRTDRELLRFGRSTVPGITSNFAYSRCTTKNGKNATAVVLLVPFYLIHHANANVLSVRTIDGYGRNVIN